MKLFAETNRLLLRPLRLTDDQGMFELDSDPQVHRFLGQQPVSTLAESQKMIRFIRRQYRTNGIGRWAVVNKNTNEFLGWAGLKLIKQSVNQHSNYYDVGYRLIRRYWGQGFATEAALASVRYGFEELKLPTLYAMAHCANTASRTVLEKCGLRFVETFDYQGEKHSWHQLNNPNR